MLVKEKVFILKKIRYGESDLIISCLTPRGERISLFARSALKSKKRFGGGVLEPTHYAHVLYDDKSSSARSENPLNVLKEASLIQSFDGLRTDYARIETALHIVRLIAEVVQEGDVESADLFNLLGNTLRAAETSGSLEKLRSHFEFKLLANQGVVPIEEETERILLSAPIVDHEKLPLSDAEWSRARGKIRRVLREYLDQGRGPEPGGPRPSF